MRTFDQVRHAERKGEEGATATEYGLLVGFIALVLILGATAFGTALNGWFEQLAAAVTGF